MPTLPLHMLLLSQIENSIKALPFHSIPLLVSLLRRLLAPPLLALSLSLSFSALDPVWGCENEWGRIDRLLWVTISYFFVEFSPIIVVVVDDFLFIRFDEFHCCFSFWSVIFSRFLLMFYHLEVFFLFNFEERLYFWDVVCDSKCGLFFYFWRSLWYAGSGDVVVWLMLWF